MIFVESSNALHTLLNWSDTACIILCVKFFIQVGSPLIIKIYTFDHRNEIHTTELVISDSLTYYTESDWIKEGNHPLP
jgi:uncharacterized membrane protein YjfL (UPF0719 family)